MSMLALFTGLLLAQSTPGSGFEQFFTGRTEGRGTVQVLLSGRHSFRVRSRGRTEGGGVLILDQIVDEDGRDPRRRTWRLSRNGTRISGTITDARGPVTGEIDGNVVHMRYRSVEGPSVEMWITLSPDGRTARNRMRFRQYGLPVATAEESIWRVD